MAHWRTRETDDEEFEHLTLLSLDLQTASSPKHNLEDDLLPRTILLRNVLRIAEEARDEARRRDPDNAAYVGSLCTAFQVVATTVSHLLDGLNELLDMYEGHEPGLLRLLYETKLLHWQTH